MRKCDDYLKIRHLIGNGCIGLISKDKLVSKVIRRHDRNKDGSKAEFSHVFGVFELMVGGKKRLFVLDSNETGVKPAFLSDRIKDCDNFIFLKPNCSKKIIDEAINASFDRAKRGIRYDFLNGFKELFNRRYKKIFKIKKRKNNDICSEWTRAQVMAQNMMVPYFAYIKEPFPQDYIRYIKPEIEQIR